MGVISVESIPEGWAGNWDKQRQRTYKRKFRVETDSRDDGPVTIRLATTGAPPVPLVPRIGSKYFVTSTEQDAGSFCSNVATDFEDLTPLGLSWILTFDYAPFDFSLFGNDPTAWPILITFGSAKYERIVTVDQDGNPILNSAGDPFESPVTIDESRSIITVQRNELVKYVEGTGGFNPLLAELYRDTVNNELWNGFEAKTVKCSSITTGAPQYDSNNEVWYYQVTYVFEIDRDAWTKRLLDQGYNVISAGVRKPYLLGGQKPEEPILLNGSGAFTTTPHFLSYEGYPLRDFSIFNLDFNAALGRS